MFAHFRLDWSLLVRVPEQPPSQAAPGLSGGIDTKSGFTPPQKKLIPFAPVVGRFTSACVVFPATAVNRPNVHITRVSSQPKTPPTIQSPRPPVPSWLPLVPDICGDGGGGFPIMHQRGGRVVKPEAEEEEEEEEEQSVPFTCSLAHICQPTHPSSAPPPPILLLTFIADECWGGAFTLRTSLIMAPFTKLCLLRIYQP